MNPLSERAGVFAVAELLDHHWTRAEIDRAIRTGALFRLRWGWVGRVNANPNVAAAVRAGGSLACASALREHGVWIPQSLGSMHVRFPKDHRRKGCSLYGKPRPVKRAIDDVETAFRCLLKCGTAEDVIVAADSLLHLELATRHELDVWTSDSPQRIRNLICHGLTEQKPAPKRW